MEIKILFFKIENKVKKAALFINLKIIFISHFKNKKKVINLMEKSLSNILKGHFNQKQANRLERG